MFGACIGDFTAISSADEETLMTCMRLLVVDVQCINDLVLIDTSQSFPSHRPT